MHGAELVVVVDAVEPQPFVGREFDKFYRVRGRVAGVIKGNAAVGDRLEVVVDQSIAEQRNDCCTPGGVYVLFLREQDGRHYIVGSPLGTTRSSFRLSSEAWHGLLVLAARPRQSCLRGQRQTWERCARRRSAVARRPGGRQDRRK